MPQKNTQHDRKIRLIAFLAFLFGFSVTLVLFIASSYFEEALQSDNVGIFFTMIFSVLLIGLFNLDKFFTMLGRGRTLILLFVWQISVLFALTVLDITLLGAFFLILYFIIYGTIMALWDVVIEAYSTKGQKGSFRGMFLSVWGMGALIGPIVGTKTLEIYGFHGVFTVSLVVYCTMFIVSLITLHDLPGRRPHKHTAIAHVLRTVWTKPALMQAYYLAMLLRAFYAVMSIYVPLYLRDIGFSWPDIGIIFTAMLLPFIFLQYPAGVLADKKWGEKELLIFGLAIIVAATAVMGFVSEPIFWLWFGLLVVSRIGCALFEAMQDSYFYKHINGSDAALSNFYRTSRPVAYILASLIASIVLIVGDIPAVFMTLTMILLTGFIALYYLKDTQPEQK